MRIILFILIVITVISCGSKKDWDEKRYTDDCVVKIRAGFNTIWLDSEIGKENFPKLCESITEKSVPLYKNEKEAQEDQLGYMELLKSCVEKVKKELGK